MSEQAYSKRDEYAITDRIAAINNFLRHIKGKPEEFSQEAEQLRIERHELSARLKEVRKVTRMF